MLSRRNKIAADVGEKQVRDEVLLNGVRSLEAVAKPDNLEQVLSEARRTKTPIKEQQIWKWAAEVTAALRFLHAKDICHENILPRNIILNTDGHAFLSHREITSQLSCNEDMASLGSFYRTCLSLTGERGNFGKGDMFGLGCILYELMTHEPPDAGSSPGRSPNKFLYICPVTAQGYSWDLRAATTWLLQKDLAHRPDALRFYSFCARTFPNCAIRGDGNIPLVCWNGPAGCALESSASTNNAFRRPIVLVVGQQHVENHNVVSRNVNTAESAINSTASGCTCSQIMRLGYSRASLAKRIGILKQSVYWYHCNLDAFPTSADMEHFADRAARGDILYTGVVPNKPEEAVNLWQDCNAEFKSPEDHRHLLYYLKEDDDVVYLGALRVRSEYCEHVVPKYARNYPQNLSAWARLCLSWKKTCNRVASHDTSLQKAEN